VNLSTSPKVQYAYAAGSANTVRPQTMTYPNARVPAYARDAGHAGFRDRDLPAKGAVAKHKRDGSGADAVDHASRLIFEIKLGSTLPQARRLCYGHSSIVEVDDTEPDIKYTLVDLAGNNDHDTGEGSYIGLRVGIGQTFMLWTKNTTIALLTFLCTVLVVVVGWQGMQLVETKWRQGAAREQIEVFRAMVQRACSADMAEARECLEYVITYYPSGTKQERGSSLDFIVETARANAESEIRSCMSARALTLPP
jgi:hypothetical protein